MASETRTLTIGDNLPVTPSPDENPEWMRWNNYGIALLDAQQYPAAVRAFEQRRSPAPRLRRRLDQHGRGRNLLGALR